MAWWEISGAQGFSVTWQVVASSSARRASLAGRPTRCGILWLDLLHGALGSAGLGLWGYGAMGLYMFEGVPWYAMVLHPSGSMPWECK